MPKIDEEILTEIMDQLDLLATFFKGLSQFPELVTEGQQNPVTPLFEELWPFVDLIMTQFVLYDEIIDANCRLMKAILRSMGPQFGPNVQKFIRKNMLCYSQNAIGPFLYSVEFTLTKFGKDDAHANLFQEALDFVVEHSSQVLASPGNCERSPELMNDFFGMTLRYLRYNETLFFNS